MEYIHKPVLLDECIDALAIRPDGIYIDGTLGRAGHSREIVRRLTTGRLICIDRDIAAIEAAKERLAPWMDRVTLVHQNFAELGDVLRAAGIAGADGMLFDLGVSSPQLDDASRGFSYMQDAPLDMRMDTRAPLTAYDVVNTWSQDELRRILYEYGEERYAPAIARAIVRARETAPVGTTLELVDADPLRHAAGSPAGKAASCQAQLPGHPDRGERGAGCAAADAAGRCGWLGPRRTAGGDHLPLAGGPHRQADDAGSVPGLYLPAGVPGMRVREAAPVLRC